MLEKNEKQKNSSLGAWELPEELQQLRDTVRRFMINEVKPVSPEARMMERSMQMDFVHADKAPADELNDIIWKSIKGWDATEPPTPKASQPLAGG